MIRAEEREGSITLVGVASGEVAYVDADALPASPGPVPALSVSAEGLLAWRDGPRVQAAEPGNPDALAALAFLAVAREAAAPIAVLPPGSVEVRGGGLVAHYVTALVGTAHERSAEPPQAIVDVTGDPGEILDATRRVADLGTVVLAGEALGRQAEINLYPDVHVRGLTLVGVAPPLHGGRLGSAQSEAETPLVESSREFLVTVTPGSPLPPGSRWYRLSR